MKTYNLFYRTTLEMRELREDDSKFCDFGKWVEIKEATKDGGLYEDEFYSIKEVINHFPKNEQ